MAVTASPRYVGVSLFIALTLLVSIERRLAELDIGTPDEVAFEDVLGVDGGEILDRTLIVDDTRIPVAPDAGPFPIITVASAPLPRVVARRISTRAPRAPPRSSSS